MEANVSTIKELIDCLNKSGIDKLSLETKEFKLTLEKNEKEAAPTVVTASEVTAVQVASKKSAASVTEPCGNIVKAPIVGTFYTAPSPDKPPFVKVGQQVKKGDTLFIIESMKLMNEITSDYTGTVAEILIESGQNVEYGQPVMRIE